MIESSAVLRANDRIREIIKWRAEKKDAATLRYVITPDHQLRLHSSTRLREGPCRLAETDAAASNVTLHTSDCGERGERREEREKKKIWLIDPLTNTVVFVV